MLPNLLQVTQTSDIAIIVWFITWATLRQGRHLAAKSITISSATRLAEFPINQIITCTTKNIIYDLWCDKCKSSADPGLGHYVGKTTLDGATRFSQHKSDVNLGKNTAVARHFNLPGHSSSHMRYLPFECVAGDATLLASREEYWIRKKKTFESGINLQK